MHGSNLIIAAIFAVTLLLDKQSDVSDLLLPLTLFVTNFLSAHWNSTNITSYNRIVRNNQVIERANALALLAQIKASSQGSISLEIPIASLAPAA